MILEELQMRQKFLTVRKRTEEICKPLTPEDHVVQPIVDVSPPKWHLGHTTWFFETFILISHLESYTAFNPKYNYLFNSYYESVGKRVIRTDRGNMTRPTVAEVMEYRKYVDEHIVEFLEANPEMESSLEEVFELGLQHEQQHQELLLYDIKYILGNNPLFPAYLKERDVRSEDPGSEKFIEIEGGSYEIGHQGEGFCFDNELGRHQVYLHDYAIMDRLVTNGEFLEFMVDGGYQNFRYWLSEGWEWVNVNDVQAPYHWHLVDGHWQRYSLRGGLTEVDMYAPVTHISFFEADAYAKWKGLRLPTEMEWEVAAQRQPEMNEAANFMESKNFEPVASSNKNNQMFGDVWEWTHSAYLPYPFYEAPEGAVGEYNGKFMINQMVLRGGSCATPRDHIRSTYRNFFHPHLRWMFSGMRLAKTL